MILIVLQVHRGSHIKIRPSVRAVSQSNYTFVYIPNLTGTSLTNLTNLTGIQELVSKVFLKCFSYKKPALAKGIYLYCESIYKMKIFL